MKKKIKIILIFLIIIAICIVMVLSQYNKKQKENKNLISNTELTYTEKESQEFYTKKLIKYLDIFKSDFFMKYEVILKDKSGKTTSANEEYSMKDGKISVNKLDAFERVIIDGKTVYYIKEPVKTIFQYNNKEKKTDNQLNKILMTSLEDINKNFVKTGNEKIGETQYYFEEYNSLENDKANIKYYFKGEELKLIVLTNEDNSTSTFKIERLDAKTYDYSFQIPKDYETIKI